MNPAVNDNVVVPMTRGRLDANHGWFKASRFLQMPDLVKKSPNAFILAYALAYRARWNPNAFNPYKLAVGEAVCDYANWGLTERRFRTAKATLEKWGFATFRATGRGTVGKLTGASLFEVVTSPPDGPSDGRDDGRDDGLRRAPRAKSQEKGGAAPTPRGLPFVPPTLEQCLNEAAARNIPEEQVKHFFDHYTTGGWCKDRGLPIANWKQALVDWNARQKTFDQTHACKEQPGVDPDAPEF